MRLYPVPKARRASSRRPHRSWLRPLLERLEDRVVPSLADGTLLVATSPSSYASTDQSSFPTDIIAVNPNNGAQQRLFVSGMTLPSYIAEGTDGQLYIADLQALGTGAVFRVDPNTGQVTKTYTGGFIDGPNALVYLNGFLYVANEDSGTGSVHSIVRIDPNSGAQTLITDGPNRIGGGTNTTYFSVPTGMVPAGGDNVFLADEQGSFNSSSPLNGQLVEVNLDTGVQSVFSSGGFFDRPVDVAMDASGNIIVVNTGDPSNNDSGSLFRITPQRSQSLIVNSFGNFSGIDSVEVGESGTILVGAIADGPLPGRVFAVNPNGFNQYSIRSSDVYLSLVEGMRTYHFVQTTTGTTTAVTSTANPSFFGQSVTFTAAVTSNSGIGTPTGTVQFQIDGTNFGTPAIVNSSGLATSQPINNLSVNTHTVTAIYSGDANFSSSIGMLAQTVLPANTSTAVTSSVNPSAVGQTVTFTATVSVQSPGTTAAANPTGTVSFFDGSSIIAMEPVSTSGGVTSATFATAGLPAGTHTITASYSGDGNFTPSSGSLTQSVTSKPTTATTTAVASSVNPSVSGQSVTFTATVMPSSGSTTPTGTVQFQIDNANFGSPVSLNSSGVATSQLISTLSIGGHTITATYSGDMNFSASTSTPFTQTVNPASTSTAVSSSVNPSVLGQPVTFTATVSVQSPGTTAAANPTGTVTFFDGSTSLGTGTLSTSNGITSASFTTSALALATHSITATYNADTNFTGSNGTLASGQTVNKANTTTAVISSVNPSALGQSVTFTATVSVQSPGTTAVANPTGTVTFFDGSTNLGSGTLSTNGSGVTSTAFTTSALTVGTHTITATYSGDNNFNGSNGTLAGGQTVNKANTSTSVVSSSNPSISGQMVTFTATVSVLSPGTTAVANPTGMVTFFDGSTNLGSGTLSTDNSGVTTASFSTAALSLGTHTITASYGGDNNFTGSTGSLTQTVNAKPTTATTTAVSSSVNSPVFGQSVTFTATVTPNTGGGTPTGTVQFQIDGATFGSPASLNGSGTATSGLTSSLSVGSHTITAVYSGDSNFSSSIGKLTLTVGQASTTTTVSSSPNPSAAGQSVTFTAIVSVQSPGTTAAANPSGTVTFFDGSTNLGQGTLTTSTGVTSATLTISTLSVGTHTITATYAGDVNFIGSSGTLSTNQLVNQAATTTVVTSSANPSVTGQMVTFTATISVQSPGAGTPTGTVQFVIDGNANSPVNVTPSGTASFSTASLSVGTHTVSATYSGDTNFTGSSGSLAGGQTVNKAPTTTTTVVSSSANPSVVGQTVTFTATVSFTGSGAPTGTVQFVIDGTAGSPVNVTTNASVTSASYSTASLGVGTHTVSATYSGDGNFTGSSGTLSGGQTVTKGSTSTAVSSSINPSVYGQSVTFTATVSLQSPAAGTPTGTVLFQFDGNSYGSAVTVSPTPGGAIASFSIPFLNPGTHTVTATYSGDNNFARSIGTLPGGQTVLITGKMATTTTVSSSANPSTFGQTVTFTAAVSTTSAGTPTGSVQFVIDGTPSGSAVSLSPTGTASLSITSLSVGTHTVTASYSGDNNFAASSNSIIQTVTSKAKTATTTVVASSVNPSVFGQSVTFTATVAPTSGTGTPTGTVQFSIDGNPSGSAVTLSASGIATISTSSLAVGSHTVSASYSGDGSFTGSSGTLSSGQTVNKANTNVVVSSSANPSVVGQSVTFTATISAQSPGAGVPTGTVQFAVDGSTVGSPVNVTTAGGVTTASFSTASLPMGTHTITATYSGDSNFTANNGSLTQTVNSTTTGSGNVTATLNSGVLSITGDANNDAITVQQVSPGVLQVAGVGTLINQSSSPATFALSSITEIDVAFLNGNDSVTMNNFSIPGTLSIMAGSGMDTINLNNTAAGGVVVTTGDNTTLALNGVNSTDSVKLTAGNNANVSLNGVMAVGDVDVFLGDNAQSVTVKGSSSYNLFIRQTGTKGNPFFDLENDTFYNDLNIKTGNGNDKIVLSHLNVFVELFVLLGVGKNTLSADHVTALFGFVNGGTGGSNTYNDGGGNSGYVAYNFN